MNQFVLYFTILNVVFKHFPTWVMTGRVILRNCLVPYLWGEKCSSGPCRRLRTPDQWETRLTIKLHSTEIYATIAESSEFLSELTRRDHIWMPLAYPKTRKRGGSVYCWENWGWWTRSGKKQTKLNPNLPFLPFFSFFFLGGGGSVIQIPITGNSKQDK